MNSDIQFAGTPGPWCVKCFDDFFVEAVSLPVCVMPQGGHFGDTMTRRANALLISAAPDLLEAAKQTNIDLNILLGHVRTSVKSDPKWEGFDELIQKWISRNEIAIQKALTPQQ